MGEKIMGFLEKSFDFIKKLVVNGPLALWGVIKEKIGNIKQMFFGGIIGWLRNTIIVKALTRIALMLNPVGAIIGIVKAIYDIIMFFVNNWKRIVDLVSTIFNSLNEIAFGRIGKAAGFILGSLIKAVPIVISFLARLLNISGIVNKVKQIIGKIKKPVDKAVGKVVGWVVKTGKKLWAKIKGVAGKVFGKAKAWWNSRKSFKAKDGHTHTLYFKGSGKNARVFIASNPKDYEFFIKDINTNNASSEEKTAKSNAQIVIGKIYRLIREKGNATGEKEKQLNKDIDILTNELKKNTAVLFRVEGLEDIEKFWHIGNFESAEECFMYHYRAHKDDPGISASTPKQYLNKARGFQSNLKRADNYPVKGDTPGVRGYAKKGLYIYIKDRKIVSFGKKW